MIAIKKIAKKYKLLLLEDCALALGSKVSKNMLVYSVTPEFFFLSVKHITSAEGGMVITNNKN